MQAAAPQVKAPFTMNHFISGILKIILLEAQMAWLLFDRTLRDRYAVPLNWGLRVLAALMGVGLLIVPRLMRNSPSNSSSLHTLTTTSAFWMSVEGNASS